MSSVHNGWNWILEKCKAEGRGINETRRDEEVPRVPARTLSLSLSPPVPWIIYQGEPYRSRSKLWKFRGLIRPCACVHARYLAAYCAHKLAYPGAWSIVYFWLAYTLEPRSRRREAFHFSTFPTSDPRAPSFLLVTTEIFRVVSFCRGWLTVGWFLSPAIPSSRVVRFFFPLSPANFFVASEQDWTDRNAAGAKDRWASNSRRTDVKRRLAMSYSKLLISTFFDSRCFNDTIMFFSFLQLESVLCLIRDIFILIILKHAFAR